MPVLICLVRSVPLVLACNETLDNEALRMLGISRSLCLSSLRSKRCKLRRKESQSLSAEASYGKAGVVKTVS